MKRTTFLLAAILACSIVFSQEKTKMRVIIMNLKPGTSADFEKGLVAHNAKYHPKDKDPVSIYKVMSGSRSGEYHYIQSGLDWAGIEGKNYPPDHEADWAKNAGMYISSAEVHYLNFSDEYSYNASPDPVEYEIISFVTVKQGEYGTYIDMLKTRKEALTKAKDDRHLAIFSHSFAGTNSEFHFAIARALPGGLKDLDKDGRSLQSILNEQDGPYATHEWQKRSDASIKKVEVFLVRRMASLSSK